MTHKYSLALILILSVGAPPCASAQAATIGEVAGGDRSARNEILQEVVVSATRRGNEVLQKVPETISVVSPTDLDEKGLGSLQDVAQLTPSVSVQSMSPGSNLVEMRGLSVFSLDLTNTQERPLVAVYLDDTPISLQSANPDLQVYDLERVEVIRGPQGTLYGASAMAGAIRFITKKPDLHDFDGSADTSLSETHHGGTNYSVRSAVNLPLIDDTFGLRLNGFRSVNSGYIDNIYSTPRDNDDASTQARAALRWHPVNGLNVDASMISYRLLAHGLSEVMTELRPYTDAAPTPQPLYDDLKLYNVTVDWAPARYGEVVSSSSVMTRDLTQEQTASYLLGSAVFGQVTPSNSILSYGIHTFTQEIRWISPAEQTLKTVVGAFYERSHKVISQNLPTPGLDAALGPGYQSVADYGTPEPDDAFYGAIDIHERQAAVFGEATYPILPKLNATLGVRYFNFKEDFNLYFTGFAGALAPGVPAVQQGEERPSGVNPKAALAYSVSDAVMVFAEAARGFRYGGVNEPVPPVFCGSDLAQLGIQSAPVTFGPDSLWSYTLGEKGTFADGLLRANLSGFFVDWKNVQTIKNLTCGYYFAEDKGDVTSKGIEAELETRPTKELTLGLNASFTDATAHGPIENLDAASGDRVPFFPRVITTLYGRYQINLSPGEKLVLSTDLTYRSNAFTEFSPEDPLYREIPSSKLWNSSITYDRGRWAVALFGTNLTNDRLVTYIRPNTFGAIQPGDQVYVGRPRTIGIRGHVNF
jgi:iron complex outermembrane recepter protein